MNIGTEAGLQLDMLVRIVVAAIVGAAIGIEREGHDHPAGRQFEVTEVDHGSV